MNTGNSRNFNNKRLNAPIVKKNSGNFQSIPDSRPKKPVNNFSEQAKEWRTGNPFKLGISYLKNQNYALAERSFLECLEINEDHLETRLKLGLTYLGMEKYSEAVKEFKKVLKADPKNYEIKMHLGQAYFKMEKFEMAIREYTDALKLFNTDDARKKLLNSYLANGNSLYKQKDYQQAAKNFESALEYEENNPVLLQKAGLSYIKLDKIDKAVQYLENAIRNSTEISRKIQIYTSLIDLHLEYGNESEVLRLCNEVRRIDTSNPLPHYYAGEIYFNRREYEMALVNYKNVLNLDPEHIQSLLNIGQIYVIKNELDEARTMYDKILELEPGNHSAMCNIAIVKYRQGDYAYAYEMLNKLIHKLKTKNYLAFKYLGIILLEKGFYKEAAPNFAKAIELNPSQVENYVNLGVCYHQQFMSDDAIKAYSKAIELDPENLIALKNLALLFFEAEHFGRALKLYERALELKPDSPDILKKIGECYQSLDDTTKALSMYMKYLNYKDNDGEVLLYISHIYFESEDFDNAGKYLGKLSNVSNYYRSIAYCYLSKISQSREDNQNAYELARASVMLNTQYVDGLLQYGVMCTITGHNEKAKHCFEKVQKLEPDNNVAEYYLTHMFNEEEPEE